MSTLLQKNLKVNRIIATNLEQTKALDDLVRIKTIQILYHKQLSAEQIAVELSKAGYKKATTTIRHHLDILKKAKLIEIVKMEEVRGAVMKFYGTSVRIVGSNTELNFDASYHKTITDASLKVEKILKNIIAETNSKIKKNDSDGHDSRKNVNESVLMEIVNRAMTNIFEDNHSINSLRNTKSKSIEN
ncbi:MAG: winged helix-turn-helix transcriptional regulator [Thaumarchaeota archaeon]|nr:winged helix-turn-helix transcriptional regulator [Nitrososphaerota archaeon]